MAKPNKLADKALETAMQQLQTSWNFKLPRVRRIRTYRRLYNGMVEPKLRSQFNVPLPVFPGMIDTLQADLNDKLLLKYASQDPADYKAEQKANAAIRQASESQRPGAQWDKKHRMVRQELIITGRGIEKFTPSNNGGFTSDLEVVPFEDFFFEPTGGGNLENHLFAGQQNIWKTKQQLLDGVQDGIYDARQVKKLLGEGEGYEYKAAGIWDGQIDFANRFKPLGLDVEGNNYVGEPVFNMCEWVLNYQGRRWYLVFDVYAGVWVRFEKLEDIHSSGYLPWMSCASHEDPKNFASKSFADDLYPVADAIITLFNQDLTNRQKRNLNAKAYDKEMFKDVAKLDEAQYRPDALVPVDTKNGTRRIAEGLYAFNTPELTGTIDMVSWLQTNAGQNLGVTDMQQGAAQGASKRVGVAYAELAQVSKRLAYTSAPFQEMGLQLGMRFWGGLKDYMKEPMAVKLYGETGVEWEVFKRIDLSLKKDFEIVVTSQSQEQGLNERLKADKVEAMGMLAEPDLVPVVNPKVKAEFIARDIGKFSEYEVALLLDTSSETDRETMAEVSAAIQDIVLRGKMPKENWNADRYFLKRLLEFAKNHKDTLPAKKFDMLMKYAEMHVEIAAQNVEEEARQDVRAEREAMGAPEVGADGKAAPPAAAAPGQRVPLRPTMTR